MQDTCTHHFEPQRFDRVSSGGQGRSKYGQKLPHIAPYCSVFWPSLTPTVDPVKSLWFKMVCTCVPHIVLHVLSSISTSGRYFRPQKTILAKNAIFGWFGGKFTLPVWCHLGNIEWYNGWWYSPLYICIRLTQDGLWQHIGFKKGFITKFCGLGFYSLDRWSETPKTLYR